MLQVRVHCIGSLSVLNFPVWPYVIYPIYQNLIKTWIPKVYCTLVNVLQIWPSLDRKQGREKRKG